MPANARSHAVLTTESKVTIRGQTTIPAPVREALKLKPGQDSIHYEILPGGQVFMCRLGDEQEDHTMNAFCVFWMQISRTTREKLVHSTFNKERNLSLAWTSTLMMRLATTNNGFSTKGYWLGAICSSLFSGNLRRFSCRSRDIKGKRS